MRSLALRFVALFLFGYCPASQVIAADSAPVGLTFFGWSDQHVKTDGSAAHLLPAIDAMNALPGTPYPDRVGGKVDPPAFVFGCGDMTEWPTHAAVQTYDELITGRLKFPVFDIVGNHDEGGNSPSETAKKWILARHKALSYTFTEGGVHFVCLYSRYDESLNNPAQPLSDEALQFVRKSLAEVPAGQPVIVAAHLCYDAMTNRDALVDAIGSANVVAILGGHYHKAKSDRYRNQNFIQLPSPAPGSSPEFMVVRITAGRLVALPYDYQQHKWIDSPRNHLDIGVK